TCINAPFTLFEQSPTGVSESVTHRVQEGVDAERVANTREPLKVGAAVTFTLECVAEIGIVPAQHDHVATLIEDGASVWDRALRSALGCATASRPEADRRNLWDAVHLIQHVKERVSEGNVDDRILGAWECLADLIGPIGPGTFAPKVIRPQEATLEQV